MILDVWLGKGSKTPVTENVRDGGGYPPFSVIFFPLTFWPAAFRDGGRGEGTPITDNFRDWGF